MQAPRPSIRRPRLGRVALLLGLATVGLSVAPAALAWNATTPTALSGGTAAEGRPDQVYVKNERTGDVKVVSGTIVADGIDKVTVSRDGKEQKLDAALVQEVIWGESSMAFQEGFTYFDRGDWENAAAKFLVAAGEDERAPVKAAAQLYAARALMNWGALDSAHYAEAAGRFDDFLSDNGDNRQVPLARSLQARNAWLAGDAAKAGGL